jgi:hypothetical protein
LIEAINAVRGLVRGGNLASDEGATAVDWLGRLDLVLSTVADALNR